MHFRSSNFAFLWQLHPAALLRFEVYAHVNKLPGKFNFATQRLELEMGFNCYSFTLSKYYMNRVMYKAYLVVYFSFLHMSTFLNKRTFELVGSLIWVILRFISHSIESFHVGYITHTEWWVPIL